MTTILSLPYDVFANVLFSFLPTTALKVLERVSQATRAIVWQVADEHRTHVLDLGNKKMRVVLSGSVANYFRNHLTNQVLSTHPEFFGRITTAQEAIEKEGEEHDPNDSTLVLVNYAKKQDDNDLMLAMVPYDFHGSQLIIKADEEPGCLGDLMITAIRENETELLRLVLAHPNAKDIQCDGAYGLMAAMKEVIKSSKNAAQLRLLFSHPNAEEIQEDSLDNRLGALLIEAIIANNLELVNEILLLPNAKNIVASGSDGIADAAFSAINVGNAEILKAVLAHPSAPKISIPNHGRNLAKAAMSKNPKLFDLVLSQPNTKDLPAEGKFGLEGALQEAVETRNLEIASKILAQPNASKISREKFNNIVIAAQVRDDQEMIQLLKGFYTNLTQ